MKHYVSLRDRIERVVDLHREDLIKNKPAAFVSEIVGFVREAEKAPPQAAKDLIRPSKVLNEERFKLIQEMQSELLDSDFNIPAETTGIVLTHLIAKLRKSVNNDDFEHFAEELFQICKPQQRSEPCVQIDIKNIYELPLPVQ